MILGGDSCSWGGTLAGYLWSFHCVLLDQRLLPEEAAPELPQRGAGQEHSAREGGGRRAGAGGGSSSCSLSSASSPPLTGCCCLQLLLHLEDGLGVSLVNKVPEELVFVTLAGIRLHFTRTAAHEVLELSVQRIQVGPRTRRPRPSPVPVLTRPARVCRSGGQPAAGLHPAGDGVREQLQPGRSQRQRPRPPGQRRQGSQQADADGALQGEPSRPSRDAAGGSNGGCVRST